MTADQYRAALDSLGLTQAGAAIALDISLKTSQRYANKGAPRRIELALKQLEHEHADQIRADNRRSLNMNRHFQFIDRSEPTYENQLWHARKLLAEKGAEALRNHALIGKECGCKDCFCCAALEVYQNRRNYGVDR